ncbi:MAG: DUF4203 domain-containing protein [Pseudohongiellaceae bacterium]
MNNFMNNFDPIILISIAGGLVVLFFGRRLFWLYIGIVGFLAGFELAQELAPQQPEWLFLVVGLVLGVCMALLAMAFQYVAVALAGFAGGAYLALQVATVLPMVDPSQISSWLLVIPGLIGAGLCLLVFDPALIVLTSLTGSAILAQLVPAEPLIQNILLVVLGLIGIGFQLMNYQRKK